MKTIRLQTVVEPLNIEIGDQVIEAEIRCDDSTLNSISAKLNKAKDRIYALDRLKDQTDDPKKLDKMAKELADLMAPIIKQGVGEETYEAVLTACGGGRRVSPKNANLVMTQLFAVVAQTAAERIEAAQGSKAAHYLQEVAHAQADAVREP